VSRSRALTWPGVLAELSGVVRDHVWARAGVLVIVAGGVHGCRVVHGRAQLPNRCGLIRTRVLPEPGLPSTVPLLAAGVVRAGRRLRAPVAPGLHRLLSGRVVRGRALVVGRARSGGRVGDDEPR
jgi:hypothetical protein